MASNVTTTMSKTMTVTSNGVWHGDNPINFALPLVIIKILLVITVTRTVAFFFTPLKQPRFIAEVVGGILLGPSALGKNTKYMTSIFPKQSIVILNALANMGLMFFLFMVGLELDMKQIRKKGSQALAISAAGIAVPFASGVGVFVVLHQTIASDVKFGPILVFMGVAMSIAV